MPTGRIGSSFQSRWVSPGVVNVKDCFPNICKFPLPSLCFVYLGAVITDDGNPSFTALQASAKPQKKYTCTVLCVSLFCESWHPLTVTPSQSHWVKARAVQDSCSAEEGGAERHKAGLPDLKVHCYLPCRATSGNKQPQSLSATQK